MKSKRPRGTTSPAFELLCQARSLAYAEPNEHRTVESRLSTRIPRLAVLLKQFKAAAPGDVGNSESGLLATLRLSTGLSAASPALRLLASLDSAYAELFTADRLEGKKTVPEPHQYMAVVLGAPRLPKSCDQCQPATAASLLCTACTKTNPQLAYLRLRSLEASSPALLDLPRLSAAALRAEGPSPAPLGDGPTMRGSDPLGCPAMRQWQAAVRVRVCAWSSFACPDAACAAALLSFCASSPGGLHEVGAGTGYWAAYLRSKGLAVTASDSRPVDATSGPANEYHSRLAPWAPVGRADASVASSAAGAARGVLLLCYPPPPPGACMGLAAVKAFVGAGGDRLALVGEMRGDTGSVGLERHLAEEWVLAAAPLPLPAYADTAACLTLWQRQKASAEIVPTAKKSAAAATSAAPAAIGPTPVRVMLSGQRGEPLLITITSKHSALCIGTGRSSSLLVTATSRSTTAAELTKALGSMGDPRLIFDPAADVTATVGPGLHLPLGEVKAARREAVGALLLALAGGGAGGIGSSVGGSLGGSVGSSSSSGSSGSSNSSSSSITVPPLWPLVCAGCGGAPSHAAPMLRDRLTRAVVACSEGCARLPRTRAALEAALAMRYLPPLDVWESLGASVWRQGTLL